MTNERKAPKDWATWADFANCYDLVLFNECTNLMHRENGSEEGVLYEWLESHTCENEEARAHLENCDTGNCEECSTIKNDYGDCPECSCEPYQWYAIAVSDWDMEFLNKNFDLDIFYSETLGLHILPVYHWGTAWDYVSLKMIKED